ncbi:MAG: hypothetical protein RR557_06145 [Bacilli bacterium]
MDELLKVAELSMEKFNPATDSAENFEKLPDADYSCLLEEVTSRKNDKGTEWISLKFSIMQGDYVDKVLFANYYFTEKTMLMNINKLRKLTYDFGYGIPVESFRTLDTLAEALNNMAGNQATVTQTTNKNGFSNYKITPLQ